MAEIIGLPKLSPTMEEGVLVKWLKKEGERVEPGDLVAEVETDKANMDWEWLDEGGVLLKLLVDEGQAILLGAPAVILGEEGEDISGLIEQAKNGAPAKAAPAAAPATEPEPAATPAAEPEPAATPAPAPAATPEPEPAPGKRLLASPLAKTLAIELGIDIRNIEGSGPGGRIIERDVRAFADAGAQAAASRPQPAAQPGPTPAEPSRALTIVERRTPATIGGPGDEYSDEPLSQMRKTIARRLTEAKQEIPHFRVTSSFDASAMLLFRKRLNELLGDRGKVSINDLLLKGAALALRRVPQVNASFTGDAIRYYTRVHLGVAVALDRGLLTPVVRNADLKGIGVISAEVKDLVDRAKNRQLKAEEIQGSTFTVSNLGMFGVDHFDAIINPPEAAILAVGRINDIPVIDGDRITVGKRMNLTLSCDHRVVDGALGARFLDELVDLLERPESLAL
jgi:pyruvate dehydrogenase E2 component (dihydrolipoamide acetyltransferase)